MVSVQSNARCSVRPPSPSAESSPGTAAIVADHERIGAVTERRTERDDEAVSERKYGTFERPVTVTDAQWRILETVRGRTVAEASAHLEMPEHQLRFLLANVGQTLSIAAKL
jgi:hypothetical protein